MTADLTAWSDGWYRVSNDVTLSDRVTVTGEVKLILCDGATLTANTGITVEGNNSLTVYAQSTGENTMGQLIANGNGNDAGIGGTGSNACGTVTIYGGSVTANGGYYSAGIGGGYHGDGGTVNIYGGSVTANGGNGGAGLGAGSGGGYGAGGTVNISGGTVTANGGGNGGAGIGGGNGGAGGTVNISGGSDAAGIGSGIRGAGGTVNISGGNVNANGNGSDGAGIGSGYDGTDTTVTLSWTHESDSITASSYKGNVTFDEAFTLEDAPTAQAYWNSASDNNIDGKTLIPSEAFSVWFDTDGGSEVDDQLVMKNGTATQPEDPTKEGYIFPGWLLDGKAYDFDTPVTDFIGLEAKWTPVATYRTPDGETVTTNPADVTEIVPDYFWWGQRDTETWYAVDGNVTVPRRVTVQGNVNLILRDGATLTAANGITVDATGSLTVYGESTDENVMGHLIADARPMDSDGYSHYTAGIGGCLGALMGSDAGEITINGGKVTAYGSDYGAGIGGGNGRAGSITVNGGIVEATGGKGGAGIGGGAWHDSGTITINGGVVNAIGGSLAADIGGGAWHDSGTITINGGNITANGTTAYYAGIGNSSISSGSPTVITLNWTNATDSIFCKYYNGEVIFDREHSFVFSEDRATTVTGENINGDMKTIVPGEYTPIPRHTVNFYYYYLDGENEELYTSRTVYDGDCVEEPEAPTKEDYEFWYWTDKDGNYVPLYNPITEDMDLYGVWDRTGTPEPTYCGVVIKADEGCEVTVIGKEVTGSYDDTVSFDDGSSDYYGSSDSSDYYGSSDSSGYYGSSDSSGGGYTGDDTSDGRLLTSGDVVEQGTVLTVTVRPKPGYELVALDGVDEPLSHESIYCRIGEVTVDGDTVIEATSQKKTYELDVQHENGTAPNVSDSDLRLDALPYGTQVTLTAGEADEGYEFIGWYQANGKQLSQDAAYTATVTGNQTLIAKYQAISGVVTFVSNGQTMKTITAESITDSDVPATPSALYGYEFSAWDKTVEEINAKLAASENVAVTALFVPVQTTFTVTVYNGESETPEEIECSQSTLISRKAAAVSGKKFAYWTLNDAIFSYNTKVSYTAIESGVLKAVYSSTAVESVGTATLRTAKYNPDTDKLTVNVYLTVPDNATIESAGLVAASAYRFDPDEDELNTYTADYVKSSAAAAGKSAPTNYTWTKSSVAPGDVWYIRARIAYWDENDDYQEVYGKLVTVTAGTDYDYAEKGTATIRAATYDAGTNKATFNAYLTVPDNAVIVKAGLVAASSAHFDPTTEVLTAANADYVKSSSAAVGKCAPVNYTWNKTNADSSDLWAARAYLVYTLNGTEHTVYGNLETLMIPKE